MSVAEDEPIDGLFALPPEDFTAARDALAKRLKAEGDADAARTVRGLRRPTVPAWAVNQLARAAPEDLERLLATGNVLRRAQRAALSGAGGGRLRDATAQRRALLAELTERAAGILADADRNPDPHRAAIAATLEAATVDDEAADVVRSGRLSRELPPPSGFGDLSALTLVPDLDDEEQEEEEEEERDAQDGAQGAAAGRDAQDAEEAGADQKARDASALREAEEARALEAEAEREARAAADEARARADQAEEAASAAEDEATRARERADGAVETVRDLERRLVEARREREETERAAVDAESSAYRARRGATDAAKRARSAADRAGQGA